MEILQMSDVIKLYEYEQFKPGLADIIAHHQALGAHWGIMNGPPYPLSSKLSTGKRLKSAAKGTGNNGSGDSKKISRKRRKALKKARKTRAKNLKIKKEEAQKKQEIEKTKEEIIKSKDLDAMFRNIDKFTNQDINDVLNRLDVERKLKDTVDRQHKLSESKARRLRNFILENIKEGAISGSRSVLRTVSKNGVKYLSKRSIKQLVKGNPEYEALVDKLFKEEKK